VLVLFRFIQVPFELPIVLADYVSLVIQYPVVALELHTGIQHVLY
jgi:hypothetical protein